MHRALGPTGRARRVEPEAGVVGAGGGRACHRGVAAHKVLERQLGRMRWRHRSGYDDLLHLVVGLDHGRRQSRQQGARHQHRLRPSVFEHVGVVVSGEQGIDGNRHDAGVHGTEKCHRPVVAVEHQQQHAFLAANAQTAQARGHLAQARRQRAIGEACLVVDEGDLVGALCIAVQQVLRKIEAFAWWRYGGFGVGHGISCCWMGWCADGALNFQVLNVICPSGSRYNTRDLPPRTVGLCALPGGQTSQPAPR